MADTPFVPPLHRSQTERVLATPSSRSILSDWKFVGPCVYQKTFEDRGLLLASHRNKHCLSSRVRYEEDSVEFDSHFESGNLATVFRHSFAEYVLVLQGDLGDPRYSVWYYFSVVAPRASQLRFHIINISRPQPLIRSGLRPMGKTTAGPWTRVGFNLEFKPTEEFRQYLPDPASPVYTLSFSLDFSEVLGPVYFAYACPYTTSDLAALLQRVRSHSEFAQVRSCAKSLLGSECPYIVITDGKRLNTEKKHIVVTGRVHPGETPASHIIHGMVEFLLSSDAASLRLTCVFHIFPMLNLDGVRHGNYRYSALGEDLNRKWLNPDQTRHPILYAVKQFIGNLATQHQVSLLCDVHGHSKKHNVFLYTCERSERVVQQALSELLPFFSWKDCQSRIQKSKEATARAVAYRQLGIRRSCTLECSLFGTEKQSFNLPDYYRIGRAVVLSCVRLPT